MADNILKGIYAKKDGVKVKFDFPSGEGGNPFEGYLEVDSGESATGTQYKGVKMVNSGNNKAAFDLNTKGNLTIKTYDSGEKGHINIEPQKNIQIKPGNNFIFDTSNVMLKGAGAKNRVDIRCEFGDYDDAHEGIGDWAGLPHGENFDEEWAECVFNARNIDLRCNAHGGIALQPCGKDGEGKENKIKFESSRTSAINATATYSEEGGKGLEFGTFNNLHSSLYTGDYRFNGNAMVYGVSRGIPMVDPDGKGSSKFDYPTQADDFKDILPVNESGETTGATWNEIVRVARKYADGEISGGGEGGGVDLDVVKDWVNSQEFVNMEDVNEAMVPVDAKIDSLNAKIFRKDKNGNLEVSAEGLLKWDEEDHSITLDEAATLDLVSDDKVAIKCKEVEFGAPVMSWAVEISKKNKVSLGGVDYYPIAEPTGTTEEIAAMEAANKAATYEQMKALFPALGVNIEKNNSTTAEIAALGTGFIGINILDLVTLANKVSALAERVATLEDEVERLKNPNEEEEPEVEPESGSTI